MDTDRLAFARSFLGKTVRVMIDRPVGYRHNGYVYPVNYGFLPGVTGGDGEEQDVYVLGTEKPLNETDAIVVGIVFRLNDVEDKLIAAVESVSFSDREIQNAVMFQEQYFQTVIETIHTGEQL